MMKKIMLSKAILGRTLLIFCLSLRICYCFHFKETKKFWKFLLMFSINGVPSGILLLKFSPLSEPMQCNCVSMKHKIKLCSSKKLFSSLNATFQVCSFSVIILWGILFYLHTALDSM